MVIFWGERGTNFLCFPLVRFWGVMEHSFSVQETVKKALFVNKCFADFYGTRDPFLKCSPS